MIVPVLLIAGYLGAGKTTLLNHLLANPGGRRIAAIVNDFGAIDIDAGLLGTVSDGVVSLKNGCICCSLQGDLLRTLASVIKRPSPPDAIVIETSGISDPAEIIRNLMDPVIFKVAPLETVVTLVDARRVLDEPQLAQDALWRSQLRAADFVLLTKTDLLEGDERGRIVEIIGKHKPASVLFDVVEGVVAPDLLFGRAVAEPRVTPKPGPSASEPFASVSWTSQAPLSLTRFQQVVSTLAQRTQRMKGLFVFADHSAQPMLFQCVGARATLSQSPLPPPDGLTAQLVLIGRDGDIDADQIDRVLKGIVVG
jgi:cobalamin biosynthesis protein CobW